MLPQLLVDNTPPKSQLKNVRSFFSGYYQTYGVNVEAACNHQCRFQFIGAAGPGVMGDRDAIKHIELGKLIQNLPGIYCAIGDCAYTASKSIILVFGGGLALLGCHDNLL